MLISLDPGKKGLSWALWQDTNLVSVGIVRPPKKVRDFVGPTLGEHARNALQQIRAALPPEAEVFRIVMERMVAYPGSSSAVANDLLDLQATAGLVSGALIGSTGHAHHLKPGEWKGQVPKTVMANRIKGTLTVEEKGRASTCLVGLPEGLHHNAWDAIGIGLYFTGRLKNR